jgi:hypothetical protein
VHRVLLLSERGVTITTGDMAKRDRTSTKTAVRMHREQNVLFSPCAYNSHPFSFMDSKR